MTDAQEKQLIERVATSVSSRRWWLNLLIPVVASVVTGLFVGTATASYAVASWTAHYDNRLKAEERANAEQTEALKTVMVKIDAIDREGTQVSRHDRATIADFKQRLDRLDAAQLEVLRAVTRVETLLTTIKQNGGRH